MLVKSESGGWLTMINLLVKRYKKKFGNLILFITHL